MTRADRTRLRRVQRVLRTAFHWAATPLRFLSFLTL
jgi:hypothetical protein